MRAAAPSRTFLFLILSSSISAHAVGAVPALPSQAPFHPPGPMAQVARDYAWRPTRVDVQAQSVKVGDPLPVKIVLLDASGKLTNALERISLSLETISPSGRTTTQNLEAAAGASSVDLLLLENEAGLTKLTVRQLQDQLLPSSNFVLIIPSQTPRAGPQLMLRVSGESDLNVRADEINYARISVYFMDSQPVRSPIEVWLTWDHGEVKPNPLTIKKGEHFAEAHWTSSFPAKSATVSVADVKPALSVGGARAGTISFVEPVAGVALSNPPNIISIVEDVTLHARFYDLAGNFVRTSAPRKVVFSSSSRIARFKPGAGETHGDFATELIPAGWGSAEINLRTHGYPPFTHMVLITYLAVLWSCVAGGLLGALANMLTNRNHLRAGYVVASFTAAVVSALLVAWSYIVFAAPLFPPRVFHSQIAIVCVAVFAGWIGAFILRKITTAFGMQREHMRP